MKNFILIGCIAASSIAAALEVEDKGLKSGLKNFYLRGDFGIENDHLSESSTSVHKQRNKVYGVGIGYAFNNVFRIDINFYKKKFRKNTAHNYYHLPSIVDSKALFLNAYIDLTDHYIRPFITGGIGYMSRKVDEVDYSAPVSPTALRTISKGRSKGAAFTIGAGVTLKINQHIKIAAYYKYLYGPKIDTRTVISTSSGSSILGRKHNVKNQGVFGALLFNI